MRVFACLAVTLDGKIASRRSPKTRVGSSADLSHLLTVRNQADAILCGGETFRQFPGVRKGDQPHHRPIQCILTRRFQIPPDAALFHKASAANLPVIIFSPEPAPAAIRANYPPWVKWIATSEHRPPSAIISVLRDQGVQTLSVEGGGQVVSLFLKEQALQEVYLTLCPMSLGGDDNPSLLAGVGFGIEDAPRTEVRSCEWKGQELYLHLDVRYTGSGCE